MSRSKGPVQLVGELAVGAPALGALCGRCRGCRMSTSRTRGRRERDVQREAPSIQ
jgi:hypothetical protein